MLLIWLKDIKRLQRCWGSIQTRKCHFYRNRMISTCLSRMPSWNICATAEIYRNTGIQDRWPIWKPKLKLMCTCIGTIPTSELEQANSSSASTFTQVWEVEKQHRAKSMKPGISSSRVLIKLKRYGCQRIQLRNSCLEMSPQLPILVLLLNCNSLKVLIFIMNIWKRSTPASTTGCTSIWWPLTDSSKYGPKVTSCWPRFFLFWTRNYIHKAKCEEKN